MPRPAIPTVQVTLRHARGAAAQQTALDAWRAEQTVAPLAVIAEGAMFLLQAPPEVHIARLAPGCVCCLGLVPLRVTLTRLLRQQRPRAVLLLVAADEHLPQLREQLASGALGPLQVLPD